MVSMVEHGCRSAHSATAAASQTSTAGLGAVEEGPIEAIGHPEALRASRALVVRRAARWRAEGRRAHRRAGSEGVCDGAGRVWRSGGGREKTDCAQMFTV
jgi:hypothetical protein